MKNQREINRRARAVRLLILDVDGVMTDGSIILDNDGNEYKAFHVRAGHGIRMLMNSGIQVAIITGRGSKVVALRAKELGITEVYQKCKDKRSAFRKLLLKYSIGAGDVAYIGDDIVDLPVMSQVGLPVAVAAAPDEVKAHASLVTKNRGGRGAVREVTDLILRAKGLWKELYSEYLKA